MIQNKAQFDIETRPSQLFKLAFLQLLGTVVFCLGLYYCFDKREALSALLGGGIASVASLFLALRLFTARANLQAEEILVRFYISMVIKVIFTLAMMAMCIIVLNVSMMPFIIAYLIAAIIVNWLFLLFYKVPVYK